MICCYFYNIYRQTKFQFRIFSHTKLAFFRLFFWNHTAFQPLISREDIRESELILDIFCYRIVFGKIQYNRQLATQSTLYLNTNICKTTPGLTKAQKELCHQQPDTVLVALQGLNEAVKECQHQFKGHRWNCSSLTTKGRNPYISAIFQKGKLFTTSQFIPKLVVYNL